MDFAERHPACIPLVIDTDIGGDGDDAIAVTVAALRLPELTLVITTDEHHGQRARFARHLLDLIGRDDVAVVAGADLGNDRYLSFRGLVPETVAAQCNDVATAVRAVGAQGPIRWVGIGPLSNLARVLEGNPDLGTRLHVTQMGGALAYRHPDRAEHNFRVDPRAVGVLGKLAHVPQLVPSDVTFRSELEITASSWLYRRFAAPDAPEWARLLRAHLDQWFERFHPATLQHDALTLAGAFDHPAIEFTSERIRLDEAGRMSKDPQGLPVRLASTVDYASFMSWLARQLS